MDKMVMVSAMDETFRNETYMYEEHEWCLPTVQFHPYFDDFTE